MNGFDKTRRLLNKTDYNHVFEQAKKMVTSEFILLYRENTLGYARLGLALSKKMIARASDRNRIKRVLRETFRTSQLPAVDIIFLARHGVAKLESRAITAKLSKTWDKVSELHVN
ncbi:MAG: ribonuclease P protein component [Tatlockia sp.]|jgi:ribonuclease P protein component